MPIPTATAAEASVLNAAAYRFAALDALPARKAALLALCRYAALKGTILLSAEGINLFVAGSDAAVQTLLSELRGWPGLEGLEAKLSRTAHQPFNRMLVRIKREIIAFGVAGIDPARHTSTRLAPARLKQWLDEGRELTLLDTRNDYEVKLGSFDNAVSLGIRHFRDFPRAARALPAEWKQRPVVMFCTGGIRCEKAGPLLEREGFGQVFQLEGGILKYFEEVGDAHYHGECFVFDQRVGVNAALEQSGAAQCFQCQEPLLPADQADPRYVPGVSCPACHRTPEQRMAQAIEAREARIRRCAQPLPGSRPMDQFKPLNVPGDCDGGTLRQTLSRVLRHVPPEFWEQEAAHGRLLDERRDPVGLDRPVRAGERYLHKFEAVLEPAVDADIRILHEDEALIVVNKPAPLPMHAGGRFYRNTLQYLLEAAYAPQKPRAAHRLDAHTTGLVLLTRTRAHAARLQTQFARGEVRKCYLARVHGHPATDFFSCEAPIAAATGPAGSRRVDAETGLAARTDVRVLQRRGDGTSLLEVRIASGRTHQIRVHLWHLGLPICGDPLYRAGEPPGSPDGAGAEATTLHLHAWQIGFRHPLTQQPLEFRVPAPWGADICRQ